MWQRNSVSASGIPRTVHFNCVRFAVYRVPFVLSQIRVCAREYYANRLNNSVLATRYITDYTANQRVIGSTNRVNFFALPTRFRDTIWWHRFWTQKNQFRFRSSIFFVFSIIFKPFKRTMHIWTGQIFFNSATIARRNCIVYTRF